MCSIKCYSFSRSLTQIEWTILWSYTYRIRSILDEDDTLNWESVGTFLNPPTTESLFSNHRYLRAGGLTEINIQHFLCMSFPSLVTLDVWFVAKETLCALQDSLESFFKSSPNIRRLSIQLRGPDAAFSKFFSNYICRWRDLQTVECSYTTLDMDAFAHLSRMPALTTLGCTLGATLSASEATLFFPNLHRLKLYSEFLDPISWLLSRTRLLVITDLLLSFKAVLPSRVSPPPWPLGISFHQYRVGLEHARWNHAQWTATASANMLVAERNCHFHQHTRIYLC